MNDLNAQSLLHEIDEDVARKRMEAWWKAYGNYVVGGALLIVLGTAAVTGWRSYTTQQEQKATRAYLDAGDKKLEAGLTDEKIIERFLTVGKDYAGTSPAVFAKLEAAALSVEKENKQAALTIYKEIAADPKVDQVFRQLADILYVNMQMDEGDIAELQAKLDPLMKEGVWRYTAQEFAGHLAIRAGDKEKAKTIFTALKGDQNAPRSLAGRAAEMVQWLNKGN